VKKALCNCNIFHSMYSRTAASFWKKYLSYFFMLYLFAEFSLIMLFIVLINKLSECSAVLSGMGLPRLRWWRVQSPVESQAVISPKWKEIHQHGVWPGSKN